MKIPFLMLAVVALGLSACSTKSMQSPNGKIEVNAADGALVATYVRADTAAGSMTIEIEGLDIINKVSGPSSRDIDYMMVSGKRRHCTNRANVYTIHYSDSAGTARSLELLVADDGLAYRHVGIDSLPPRTSYLVPEGARRFNQRYTDAYEGFFPGATTGAQDFTRVGYPMLTVASPGDGRSADDVWALITEAGIERGMRTSWLEAEPSDSSNYAYRIVEGEAAEGAKHHERTPWRVVIMGSLADIVESTLVTDVSPESTIEDTSWIEPGPVSWVYWAYNHGSNDYQIVKKYIDMAATLRLPYVLIDAEWDGMANGGDINDALAYADSLGVKTLIWYNSSTAWPDAQAGAPGPYYRLNDPDKREQEMQWLNDKGVAGMKIDFFDGDKQATTDYCIDLLESAARHRLLVNLHGATLPRGWQRTYPNLMTTEAVYGAEWYNNKPVLTGRAAAHNATLPFTRNVVGSMDYTPCTFSDSQHPHITTNAHELALPVLYESALQHWADRPESYLAQPAEVQSLITGLPTVWDETRLLAGYPGEYVVIARRNGPDWYVAAINGLDEPQQITLDLSSLAGAPGQWQIYADPDTAPASCGEYNSGAWAISVGPAPRTVTLQPRGGIVLTPAIK